MPSEATPESVARDRVDRWWRGNADRVRAFLVHQSDVATAEDLLTEVFILALRRHEVVPEPPIGWLLQTARNVVANHRRSERRFLGLVGRVAATQPAEPVRDPVADRHSGQAELRTLLAGLSDADREVLTLTAWYGLTAAEAAQALGVSVNAYGVRLHRARARLAARHRTSEGVDR